MAKKTVKKKKETFPQSVYVAANYGDLSAYKDVKSLAEDYDIGNRVVAQYKLVKTGKLKISAELL